MTDLKSIEPKVKPTIQRYPLSIYSLPQKAKPLQAKPLSYHLYTLWLFTRSDLKIVFLPQLIFATASAFTGGFTTSYSKPDGLDFLVQIIRSLLWLWICLLAENVSNQCQPSEVLEDSMNKPWRPIPSQRLTADQARCLLFAIIPAAVAIGTYFGVYRETATLFVLIWMYNGIGGADEGIIRNALNAGGFVCFNAGVTVITTTPQDYGSLGPAVLWIATSGCVILTTIHAQDLPDVVGDAAGGRRTIPLAYGETTARVTLAVGVLFWSILCAMFWKVTALACIPTVSLGIVIAFRTLMYRDLHADKVNWRLWCIWMTTIYFLPLWQKDGAVIHVLEVFSSCCR